MQVGIYNNSTKPTLIASWEEFKELKGWIHDNHPYTYMEIEMLSIEKIIELYSVWPNKLAYEVTCDKPSLGSIIQINHEYLKQLSKEEEQKILEVFNSRPIIFTNPSETIDRFIQDLISDQRREDMLVGALEGGSNYWYWLGNEATDIIDRYGDKDTPLAIAMWKAIKDQKAIPIHDIEDKNHLLGYIHHSKIAKGEWLMLQEQPKHFADIISENDDAITADMWFQYCVLGEIVYG